MSLINDPTAKITELRGQLKELEEQISKKESEAEEAIVQGRDSDELITEIDHLRLKVTLTKKALGKVIEIRNNDHAGRGRRKAQQAAQSRSAWERKEKARLDAEREVRRKRIIAEAPARRARELASLGAVQSHPHISHEDTEVGEELEANAFAERDREDDA